MRLFVFVGNIIDAQLLVEKLDTSLCELWLLQ